MAISVLPNPSTPLPDYQAGHVLVSAGLRAAYEQASPVIRTVMERGTRQGKHVFCTPEELLRAPRRFGLTPADLETYEEAMEVQGSFTHGDTLYIVPASARSFTPVLRWMGLAALLQETRTPPDRWESAVLGDLGLKHKAVPAHLVDDVALRNRYAPPILRSLKKGLGIDAVVEMMPPQNPRYWLQMMALNAVAAGPTRSDMLQTRAFYEQLQAEAQSQMANGPAPRPAAKPAPAAPQAPAVEDRPKDKPMFTNDPEEPRLVRQAHEMVDACLKRDPSRGQFRCRLGAAKEPYTIFIVLGNGRDAPEQHALQLRATSLEQAVALKKALQSHMLNRADIQPLHYGYKSSSPELQQHEVIPLGLTPPATPELRGDFFVARFVGEEPTREGAPRPVEMVFPLGLRVDPAQPHARDRIAQRRLDWLTKELRISDKLGRRETRDELTSRMRRTVVEQSGGAGWRERPAITVHGMDAGESFPLGFPRVQGTTITHAALSYMSHTQGSRETGHAEDGRNPSWELGFTLSIGEGDRAYTYHPKIRLQTSNEEAALRKAGEVMARLQQDFEAMAARSEAPYPQLRWQLGDAQLRGKIRLADHQGNVAPEPAPRYLMNFVEDAAVLVKSDFHVHAEPHAQGDTGCILSVRRGYGPEQDEKPYKNGYDQPMAQYFKASDPALMTSFAEAVNRAFREAITATYSTRDLAGNRTSLQKFNDQTVDSLFNAAVASQLREPQFAGQVRVMRHVGIAAQQEKFTLGKE